jgi:chemotaxis protein CheD
MEYYLRIAEMAAGNREDSMKTVVGSCIGLCLWDQKLRIGGMVHIMMPEKERDIDAPLGKYADTAVPALIELITEKGAVLKNVIAKLAGGASMFGTPFRPKDSYSSIGEKNHKAVRKQLEAHGIKIVYEDIGGFSGRNLVFRCSTGEIEIKDHKGNLKRG